MKKFKDFILEKQSMSSLREPTDEEIKEAEEYLEKGVDPDWDIKNGYFSIDVSGKYHVYYTLWKIGRLSDVFISNLSTDFKTAIEKAKKAAGRIPVQIDRYGTKSGMFQALKKEIFSFGKYRGQTLGEVFVEDPQYIVWLVNKYEGNLNSEFREKAIYYKELYYDTIRKRNLETSTSKFVGNVGDTITIEAEVYDVKSTTNSYNNETQYEAKLVDKDGNKYFTYNIGKEVVQQGRTFKETKSPVKKGDTVKMTAKVKNHVEKLGVKFTYLYYCKILHKWNFEEDISKFNV